MPNPSVSHAEHLPTSRIAVSSAWLARETLTAACWYLCRERLISLQPYTPTRPAFVLRSLGHEIAREVLGRSRHAASRHLGPPGRIRVARLAGVSPSAADVTGLEGELWDVARVSASPVNLRHLLFHWFADALERLEGFQVPPARTFSRRLATRISIGNAEHRVLWSVENAAIARGYLERLPVDANPGERRHGAYAFAGAFGRALRANPEPLARLEESMDAFEAEWSAFRTDESDFYGILSAECEYVLERLGPWG